MMLRLEGLRVRILLTGYSQHELCDVRGYLRALEGFREQRNREAEHCARQIPSARHTPHM